MRRRTPLKPKARKPLVRGTTSKQLNRRTKRLPVRGRSRFPKRRNAAYRKWVATLPCIVGGCHAFPSECTHVRSKGAGGDDIGNTVPLCHDHHMEQHRTGIVTFSDKYRINLMHRAAMLERTYSPKGDF